MIPNSTIPDPATGNIGPDEVPDSETLVVPGSPSPLSPGRVTVNPDDEAGVDELPNDEGAVPHGRDDTGLADMNDIDVDNAEMDGEPNPR